jgi:hypothetical protein
MLHVFHPRRLSKKYSAILFFVIPEAGNDDFLRERHASRSENSVNTLRESDYTGSSRPSTLSQLLFSPPFCLAASGIGLAANCTSTMGVLTRQAIFIIFCLSGRDLPFGPLYVTSFPNRSRLLKRA